MKKIFTDKEFIKILTDLYKKNYTVYASGGFGACISSFPSQAQRYYKNNYNMVYKDDIKNGKSEDYAKKDAEVWGQKVLTAAKKAPCWCFDCVGMIKSVLWGFSFRTDDKEGVYGGAQYKSNGVPDSGAGYGGLFSYCTDISTDFSKIVPGEMLCNDGHVGIYIGDGMVVECTTAWDNKVQCVECWNIKKTGRGRKWNKHGKLPWIEYTFEPVKKHTITLEFDTEEEKNQYRNALTIIGATKPRISG